MKFKYLIFAFLLVSCKTSTEPNKVINTEPTSVLVPHKCPEPVYVKDTVYITKPYDSLIGIIKKKNDSLFIERYKIQRIKYYKGIVQNNPTQSVFLVGWINRVLK